MFCTSDCEASDVNTSVHAALKDHVSKIIPIPGSASNIIKQKIKATDKLFT